MKNTAEKISHSIEMIKNIIGSAYGFNNDEKLQPFGWLKNKSLSEFIYPEIKRHLDIIFKDKDFLSKYWDYWDLMFLAELLSSFEDLTKYYDYILKIQDIVVENDTKSGSARTFFAQYIRGANQKFLYESMGKENQFHLVHKNIKLSYSVLENKMYKTIFTDESHLIASDIFNVILAYIVEKLEAGKSPKSILKKLKKKINRAYKNSFEENSYKYLPKAFHKNINKYIDQNDGLDQLYFESDILLILKLEFHSVKTRLNTDISATGSAKIFIEECKEDLKVKNSIPAIR